MKITLYWIRASHPANTAKLALDHKGLEYEAKEPMAGLHPIVLKLAGFKDATVPALKIDGRKVQGTLEITRELELLKPDPPLFPADPELRAKVEEAERWGESVLQPMPRRIIRVALGRNQAMRTEFARMEGIPLPPVAGAGFLPVARLLARDVGGNEASVKQDLRDLPGVLDHVDQLLAEGIIGGAEPNAADFQIGTTVRFLTQQGDTTMFTEGRPCREWAAQLVPDYPGPFPAGLPPEWRQP